MPLWLQVLSTFGIPSIMVILVQMLFKYFDEKKSAKTLDVKQIKESTDLLKKGLQSLLRYRLLKQGQKYIEQGFCSIEDKETFEAMYESYHGLGLNGVMDGMHSQVMALPTVQPVKTK